MSDGDCNLCLAINRRIINITNTHLQTIYEELAHFKVNPQVGLWLCFVCHTRLKQCYQLSLLARQTCSSLTIELFQSNVEVKPENIGLVKLSRCTTLQLTMPNHNSDINCYSVVHGLLTKESLDVEDLSIYNNEDLNQYENIGETENDNKEHTKRMLKSDNIYADIKDIACFENKVEIEISAYSDESDVKIKKEIVENEIKKEIIKNESYFDPGAILNTTITYTCNICSHMFSTLGLLNKHAKTHKPSKPKLKNSPQTSKVKLKDDTHTEKKVVCPTCGKYYAHMQSLKIHQKIHSGIRPFTCDICNKTFARKDHCINHKQTMHPGFDVYTCNKCNTHLPNKAELKTHKCESNLASYTCDICNETFDHWNQYRVHKTDAHGISLLPVNATRKVGSSRNTKISKTPIDPNTKQNKEEMKEYPCEVCSVLFTNRYSLETHVLTTHTTVRYECDHCDKVFLRRGRLRLHMRLHTGERRYCCDTCGKTFTFKNNLDAHRRVHSGDKPHACDLCDKKFTGHGQLSEHRLVHSDVRAFVCEVCNKGFKRRRYLKSHMMSHTGEKPYTCDFCFKSFARNDNFLIHRRMHTGEKPFVCDVCGETFSENRHLKKHKVVHE